MDENRQRVLTPKEFQRSYGISHTSFYKEIAEGRLRPVKYGRKTLVPVEEAERWLSILSAIHVAGERDA